MLMFNENGGFHNFQEEEVAQAKKDGWVDGEPVRQRMIAAKNPATIAPQVEAKRPPGRPRRNLAIDGVDNGYSTNAD